MKNPQKNLSCGWSRVDLEWIMLETLTRVFVECSKYDMDSLML